MSLGLGLALDPGIKAYVNRHVDVSLPDSSSATVEPLRLIHEAARRRTRPPSAHHNAEDMRVARHAMNRTPEPRVMSARLVE